MAEKSPDAYRTISEAGAEAGLPAHVLRFWESKFSQLKPVKRAGGRRLYRPQDVALLKGLRRLLYEEGYTIKGAQKYLKDHGVAHVSALGEGQAAHDAPSPEPDAAADTSATAGEIHPGPQSGEGAGPPAGSPQTAKRLRSIYHQLETARMRLKAVL